ncbi:MAG: DUF1460 domain-containing protein [Bacteroidales bacterium]|nr:DUF1460 domain-containing protein [Bacteroidales bacterium]
MKHFIALLLILSTLTLRAQSDVRFHNESADTLRLTQLLDGSRNIQFENPEERVAYFAKQFIGTPYVAHTLEGEPEILTVNLDELDCTTFVETALALAFTAGEHRNSWRDYVYNLRRIRYRGGEVNGYPSRLHYISDWAVDNKHRGNFADVTTDFPRYVELARTIDFMTANRDKYPALADSANFARIRDIENGYRQHKFRYIKTADMNSKAVKNAFHNGDVVGFVPAIRNLDVVHVGVVLKDTPESEPYLLHASYSHGKVEVTSVPLAEYMKKNRQWLGLRVFRLNE